MKKKSWRLMLSNSLSIYVCTSCLTDKSIWLWLAVFFLCIFHHYKCIFTSLYFWLIERATRERRNEKKQYYLSWKIKTCLKHWIFVCISCAWVLVVLFFFVSVYEKFKRYELFIIIFMIIIIIIHLLLLRILLCATNMNVYFFCLTQHKTKSYMKWRKKYMWRISIT